MAIGIIEAKAGGIATKYNDEINPLEEESKQLSLWLEITRKVMTIPSRIVIVLPKEITVPEEEFVKAREMLAYFAKEIARLKKEKEEKIRKLYSGNKMAALDLEDFDKLRGGNFVEESNPAKITTFKEAYSEEAKEAAYYCDNCSLWIAGSPRNSHRPGDFWGPYDYYFCRICDHEVGSIKFEIRRMRDRAYRP